MHCLMLRLKQIHLYFSHVTQAQHKQFYNKCEMKTPKPHYELTLRSPDITSNNSWLALNLSFNKVLQTHMNKRCLKLLLILQLFPKQTRTSCESCIENKLSAAWRQWLVWSVWTPPSNLMNTQRSVNRFLWMARFSSSHLRRFTCSFCGRINPLFTSCRWCYLWFIYVF